MAAFHTQRALKDRVKDQTAGPRAQISAGFKELQRALAQQQQQTVIQENSWDVVQLAKQVSLPLEEIHQVQRIFQALDKKGRGELTKEEFFVAVARLLEGTTSTPIPEKRIKAECEQAWLKTDQDNTGTIDFMEFLRWFAANRFNEDLLLSEEERLVRRLADRYDMTRTAVESIKQCFDSIDKDKSGYIEFHEFQEIIAKILRIPADVELPLARMCRFWRDMDKDGSGKVTFDEFLPWWAVRSKELIPYDKFYKQMRNLSDMEPDPPYWLTAVLDEFKSGEAWSNDDQDDSDEDVLAPRPEHTEQEGIIQRRSEAKHGSRRASASLADAVKAVVSVRRSLAPNNGHSAKSTRIC